VRSLPRKFSAAHARHLAQHVSGGDVWYCPPDSPVHRDPHQATALYCHPYSTPQPRPAGDWAARCPAELNVTGMPSYPIWVLGGTEDSFGFPAAPQWNCNVSGVSTLPELQRRCDGKPRQPVVPDTCEDGPEVVVVGGGLAGMTAAYYLSNANRTVLVLEKEPAFGGLAGYILSPGKNRVARGAAYWPDSNDEERAIFDARALASAAQALVAPVLRTHALTGLARSGPGHLPQLVLRARSGGQLPVQRHHVRGRVAQRHAAEAPRLLHYLPQVPARRRRRG
jgi:hypothetical protein